MSELGARLVDLGRAIEAVGRELSSMEVDDSAAGASGYDPDLDRFIGISEAAGMLEIHETTASQWVRQGRFPVPVVHVGGRRKVSKRRLIEFING